MFIKEMIQTLNDGDKRYVRVNNTNKNKEAGMRIKKNRQTAKDEIMKNDQYVDAIMDYTEWSNNKIIEQLKDMGITKPQEKKPGDSKKIAKRP